MLIINELGEFVIPEEPKKNPYAKYGSIEVKKSTCAVCGEKFVKEYAGQKTCSAKCENESRKASKQAKTCIQCGKRYETYFKTSKYCSHTCKREHDVAMQRERRAARKNGGAK